MRYPNGYGTVYKLGGNRRRPWVAAKTIGWDEDKKRERYIIGYFEKQEDARDALSAYNKNPIGERRDITLGDLYDEWYKGRFDSLPASEQEKQAKTMETYRIAWNHLEPLKNEKVRLLKTSHLQNVIRKMENEKNLSRSSCNKVKVLAGILFDYAMADDIVDKNYARLIKVSAPKTKRKAEVFTDLEIKTLEKNTDIEWVDTILFFIYTGMRIGEVLALTKFNIDIERMLITGGAKTDAGRDRVIPIHPKIQKFVKKWYQAEGTHLISRNGKEIRTGYYRQYLYYPTLERLGLTRLTPHKARHTFATMLHEAGVDIKTRQMLLGHSDEATTHHYTHPDIDMLKKAIAQL